MSIKFINARYLDENFQVKRGEVATDGEKISYVGESATGSFDRTIDLKGNLIIPGLKNCHTHSPMTVLRSNADDLPIRKWLTERVFPLEAKLTEEDVYYGTMLAVLEYLASGVTTASDMYFFDESMAAAIRKTRFKDVFVGAFSCGRSPDEIVSLIDGRMKTLNGADNNCFYRVGFHAPYTSDKEVRGAISFAAKKYSSPVYTHLTEGRDEVNESYANFGVTPMQLLADEGVFETGGVIYHAVWQSAEDVKLMQKYGVNVVTNSCSNVKLASGIAPVTEYLDAGIKVAIGTDGAASNNALDMFREMYLTCTLQKVQKLNAAAMPADKIFEMATKTGAEVLGLKDNDSIKVGNFADLAVIDLNQPNMQPENNIVKNLVYAGQTRNVLYTMVNGNILYEKGEFFVGEDVDRIYKKCNEIIRRIDS